VAYPNALEIDLATILRGSTLVSTGSTGDYSVFVGIRPNSPERAISIASFGGGSPNPKWLMDTVNAQISVRAGIYEYQLASQKIQKIKDLLLGSTTQTIGGSKYVSFTMPNDVSFLQYDEDQRPIWRMDITCIREPTNSTGQTNRQSL